MVAAFYLTLAEARHREMIDRAAAVRLARQGKTRGPWPVRRPAPHPGQSRKAVLRDGSEVVIGPVGPADAALLQDGFSRLSPRSRQLRFLGIKKSLTAADLRYFTQIDHHHHEALGAVDRAGGQGVGVARWVRSTEDAQTAEIAITVVDEWQRRGLGTELLGLLAERAREEGIHRFTALAGGDNAAVAGLLRGAGAGLVRRESATVVYEILLDPRNTAVTC
jgi:RimJ/RimL family protein N-acetyltransferase